VVFTCEDGERLTAHFRDGAVGVVDPQGRSFELKQRPAGSGIWYEGQDHTLRGKGEEMTWTSAGGTKACTSASSPLAGSRWRLVQFHASDGKASAPAAPENFVMELLPGGRVALQLDCNRATGRWQASGTTAGSITIDAPAMTRAACPASDSWDTRLARDLASVHSYALNDNRLDLALDAGAGVYSWTRLPASGP